ncbi:MAG TPA: MBL fold metallo-hydrolase [Bryobacteraceae bacterium]|nr:MBL fold metallo-hydrolase [Bryobacteraceae bacterium]
MSNIALLGDAGMVAWAYRAAPQILKRISEDRKREIQAAPERPRPEAWSDVGLHAAWIGHSTVLLKIDGTTILTDPVFSDRAGIDLGIATLGVKRLVAPALEIAELPKIDVVLLSHAHFDHFDKPSLRALRNRATTVVTAAKTADLLAAGRYARVQELGWEERVRVGPLEIRAFRVNHWGARMRKDVYRGYNGYTIEAGRYRVLFGGDTAATDAFRKQRSARAFDLAIMPVGAYNPWIRYHCTPEQAWQMAADAGAEFVLPVHHQTFQLSSEPYYEPIERLLEAAGQSADRVAVERIGQEFHAE